MKRIVCLVLAVIMTVGTGVPAFSADEEIFDALVMESAAIASPEEPVPKDEVTVDRHAIEAEAESKDEAVAVSETGTEKVASATVLVSGDCGAEGSNVQYALTSDGILTISGTGAMEDYFGGGTPWALSGYCDDITRLVIKEGVTRIGWTCFYMCTELTNITLPNTLTSIGDGAFGYCNGLVSVTIPSSVKEIEDMAFYYCHNLASVVILNPDCLIRAHVAAYTFGDPGYTVIRGYSGSTAEQFAEEYGYSFVSLDNPTKPTVTATPRPTSTPSPEVTPTPRPTSTPIPSPGPSEVTRPSGSPSNSELTAYRLIIDEFARANAASDYYDVSKYPNAASVIKHCRDDAGSYSTYTLYYDYYDLDKNGTVELIIGVRFINQFTGDLGLEPIVIFESVGSKAVKVSPTLGFEAHLLIRDDGSFFITFPSSARSSDYELYRLAHNGSTATKVFGYTAWYDEYQDQITGETLDKEMVERIWGNAPTVVLTGWKEIKASSSTVGWVTENGRTYYYRNGTLVKGWQYVDGAWYYFDSTGAMVTSNWASDKSGWYFMGPDGRMMEGFREIALGRVDDGWYYFNPKHDGSYGRVLTGWQQIGGTWYYFNPKHDGTFGRMVRGNWVSDKTGWYFMDEKGEMMEGLSEIALGRADDGWYYFNPKHDGSYGRVLTGWQQIDGVWYYFNPKHDGTWGKMITDEWLVDRGVKYYLGPDGAMCKGGRWFINGSEYYFNNSGKMCIGWISLGSGDYYYADSSGALVKNCWIKSGKTWYWLKADGLMARNETLTIGGVEYSFNNSGAWVTAGAAANRTAYSQYRSIVQNAASYFRPEFEGNPYITGYKYALVQMDPGDSTQTLLLAMEESEMLLNIYLYRYEPSTGKLLHPKEYLRDGVAGAGGYRGALAMCADGYGLILSTMSSGSGNGGIYRITMSGDSLQYDEVWSGNYVYDTVPDYGGVDIVWHDANDLSALN